MQIKKPARIIVASFLIAISLGCLLLLLPISTYQRISFVDALFTATSATCVTGLTVRDTASFFTPFGRALILVLFQLGGLGIMTFSTIFALVLGRRITIKDRQILSLVFENVELDIKVLLKWIFILTLIMEALGAILLKFQSPQLSFYYALFHAISAFCNAGFSLFSRSFQSMRGGWLFNLTLTFLIVTGGIGFLVLYDLGRWIRSRISGNGTRLTLHSKIALSLSLILILLGTVFLYFSEAGAGFKDYPWNEKILASYFQAVTARTAGFSTVEIGNLASRSKLFLILLMFIGASPGSTGGGIKTVTFSLIILGILSILKGRNQIRIFHRAIPLELFEKAIVIFILSISWVLLATLALLFFEEKDFLSLLFEVVSAFGTVGLSTGITPSLTLLGKFIIILTMFLGRIGPMTLAIALARRERDDFRVPEENVMVG